MEILPVKDKRDLQAFIDLAYQLYRHRLAKLRQRYKVRVRPVNMQRLEKDVLTITRLANIWILTYQYQIPILKLTEEFFTDSSTTHHEFINTLSSPRTAFLLPEKEALMIQLEIDEEERRILLQLMDTCISDLRMEISNTDNINYKDMLKHRKDILIKLQQVILADEKTAAMT